MEPTFKRRAKRAEKYDALAEGFSEREYADPQAYFGQRVDLILNWGQRLQPGDSLFEIGCGDGYLLVELAKRGLRCAGIDLSPKMVEAARRRAQLAGVQVDVKVAEAALPPEEESYDAVVALVRTFYQYIPDAETVLRRLSPRVRKKLILDFNPRLQSPREVMAQLRAAGFERVAWRPFLVPQSVRLPPWCQKALWRLGAIPGLRRGLTLWKFNAVAKGEKSRTRLNN